MLRVLTNFAATMWKVTGIFFLAMLALGQASLAYNCSNIEADRIKFDLSSLNKTEKIYQDEQTPPTVMKTTYLINPCAPLTYDEEKEYPCGNDTFICQIIVNYMKDSDNNPIDPRIISVKPIAGKELNPSITLGPTLDGDAHGNLSIILRGGFYNGEPQQANITFICSNQGNKINLINYKENTLFIEWETDAACGKRIPEEDKGMSGFTKFIIILIFIGLCYLGLGAAYNYHVYKAHGWDLLPHLDFWRDFPYLISDFFKYIVNFVRTGRTGYARI